MKKPPFKILTIILLICIIWNFIWAINNAKETYELYKTQDDWIQVEVELIRTEKDTYYDYEEGEYRTDTTGVYEGIIDDKKVTFRMNSTSETKLLYVNPENHGNYHTKISEDEWVKTFIKSLIPMVVWVFGIFIIFIVFLNHRRYQQRLQQTANLTNPYSYQNQSYGTPYGVYGNTTQRPRRKSRAGIFILLIIGFFITTILQFLVIFMMK